MADKNDDLLARAKKLKERSKDAQNTTRRRYKNSTAGQAQKHISDLHRTFTQATGTIGWLYNNIIDPVITHPWAGAPFRGYKILWNKLVYKKDKDGDDIFVKRRAGIMVLGTLAFLYMLPGILSTTAEFVWDSTWMLTTYKEEEIWYLGKSQEIDAAGNIFSAQGCEQVECSDQTSIYFRIKPSLAHHLWSMVDNGNVFFPDFVAAGIQNDINKCKVTGYGVRWKFLVRNWDVYPQILSVECMPITDIEITGNADIVNEKDVSE